MSPEYYAIAAYLMIFWRDMAPALCPDYSGVKLSPHKQPPELRIMTLIGHGFGYLDESPIAGRQWRGTSDYFALQLAYYGRAAQIGLVGIDLVPTNNPPRWVSSKSAASALNGPLASYPAAVSKSSPSQEAALSVYRNDRLAGC